MRKDFVIPLVIAVALFAAAMSAMYIGDIFTYTDAESLITSRYESGRLGGGAQQ